MAFEMVLVIRPARAMLVLVLAMFVVLFVPVLVMFGSLLPVLAMFGLLLPALAFLVPWSGWSSKEAAQ
jgi:hypothetical protein